MKLRNLFWFSPQSWSIRCLFLTFGLFSFGMASAWALANSNLKDNSKNCARFLTVNDFKNLNHRFTLINRADNRRFRMLARHTLLGSFYFHIENTVLKALNDEVFQDKTLNQAITNYFLTTFYAQVLNQPLLQYFLAGKYADYKGLRLVFVLTKPLSAKQVSILPPHLSLKDAADPLLLRQEIMRQLQLITAQTQQIFTSYLASFDSFLQGRKQAKKLGQLPPPENWFVGGTGSTMQEAAASSRVARDYSSGQIMTYDNAREILDLQLGGAENARQILTEKFKHTPFVKTVKRKNFATQEVQKVLVLSPDFLATYRILQKLQGNVYAAFKKEVRLKWNTDFSREDFSLLENYLKYIRYFSPPIYQETTVAFDFRQAAKAGALGLDLAQIGALATAKLMANLAGIEDTDHALLGAKATNTYMAQYIHGQHRLFQDFWGKKDGPAADAPMEISGDDLVIYPPKKITDGQINSYLRYLTSLKNPWGMRTVLLRQGRFQETNEEISPEDISAILIGAEDLQKTLMRELVQLLPPQTLRQTAMVIEVLPYRPDFKAYRINIALPKSLVQEVGDALVAVQSLDTWAAEYGPGSDCRPSFNLRILPAPKLEEKIKGSAPKGSGPAQASNQVVHQDAGQDSNHDLSSAPPPAGQVDPKEKTEIDDVKNSKTNEKTSEIKES